MAWRENIRVEVWLHHTGQYNTSEYEAYKDRFSRISRHCKLYRRGKWNSHRHACKNIEKTSVRLMIYLREGESRLILAIGNHSQVKPLWHLKSSWQKTYSWCISNCHWLLLSPLASLLQNERNKGNSSKRQKQTIRVVLGPEVRLYVSG